MKSNKSLARVGIWMDTHRAFIIRLGENESKPLEITSLVETRQRVEGEGKNTTRFGGQDLDPEKKNKKRLEHQKHNYIQSIIQEINDDKNSLVIFGPATMKHELEKELKKHPHLFKNLKGVEKSDSMTTNQKVAWVKEFYAKLEDKE